jgi:two-component system response regulator HydG
MVAHDWPGNVRELAHVLERAVVLGQGPVLGAEDLPESWGTQPREPLQFGGDVIPMRELQRRYAAWAYEQLDEQKVLTAEKLEIDFKTLSRWLDADPERKR